MNTADVTGAVRRLGRRVVFPALPRVQAGFKTIYRQCQPQNLAKSFPKIPRFGWARASAAALPPINWWEQLPTKIPAIGKPQWSQLKFEWPQRLLALFPDESPLQLLRRLRNRIHLPPIHVPNMGNLLARFRPASVRQIAQFGWLEWTEIGAFLTGFGIGCCIERIMRLRHRGGDEKLNMLVAIDAPVAEAILFEPVLRSLRDHYRDRVLHLWACRDVCELFSAVPYIEHLAVLDERHDQTRLRRGRRISAQWKLGLGAGRNRFSMAIIDVLGSRIGRECLTRWARTDAVCILDHDGNAREQIQSSGRLLRHMPFSPKCDPSESLALLAEQWRARILGDPPNVYGDPTAAQLAYSRARSWRSQATYLGATSIVAIAPCAHPPDLEIGLGLWATTARELWMRYKALVILLAEGTDLDAVEQLSTLLGEVPHARVGTNMDILERAGILARMDLVVASAGAAAQMALAQGVPAIIIGSPARKRLYAWAQDHAAYICPDVNGRLDPLEVLRAYRRLTMTPLPQRVAV